MASSSASTTFSNTYLWPVFFTNVGAVETDIAPSISFDVIGFLNNPISSPTFGTYSTGGTPGYAGIQWSSFTSGVLGDPNGGLVQQSLTFTYDVSTGTGGAILGFNGIIISNAIIGNPGDPATQVGLAAQETVASNGVTVGALTWTPAGSQAQWFATGLSSASVTLVVTASINAAVGDTAAVNDSVTYSGIQQGFVAGDLTIDKEVSVDGGNTWLDAGYQSLTDPQALVGCKIEYRAIIVNASTGGLSLTGVSVVDQNGPGPFTYNGQSSFSIAAGGTITTDVLTTTAVAGHQVDTANVTATATDGVHSATITGADQADYTGIAAGIAIDKQVGLATTANCGGAVTYTWYDVGSGALQDPTLNAGGTVYLRTVVTNTGSLAITGHRRRQWRSAHHLRRPFQRQPGNRPDRHLGHRQHDRPGRLPDRYRHRHRLGQPQRHGLRGHRQRRRRLHRQGPRSWHR
jgi:hypothetical protein